MQIFRTMHDFQEQCQTVVRATMCLSISIFLFKTMYNKTIIKFVFCDIRFNQGLGKCYQPWRSPRFIRPTSKYRKICGNSQQKAKTNSDILRIINPLSFISALVPREAFISYMRRVEWIYKRRNALFTYKYSREERPENIPGGSVLSSLSFNCLQENK